MRERSGKRDIYDDLAAMQCPEYPLPVPELKLEAHQLIEAGDFAGVRAVADQIERASKANERGEQILAAYANLRRNLQELGVKPVTRADYLKRYSPAPQESVVEAPVFHPQTAEPKPGGRRFVKLSNEEVDALKESEKRGRRGPQDRTSSNQETALYDLLKESSLSGGITKEGIAAHLKRSGWKGSVSGVDTLIGRMRTKGVPIKTPGRGKRGGLYTLEQPEIPEAPAASDPSLSVDSPEEAEKK